MSPKPQCLLLDANAVFTAFTRGVWEALVTNYRVVIPAVVVRTEAQFYPKEDKRVELDLRPMVAAKTIVEWEATATQLAAVKARFKPSFAQGLDEGETEALACLLSGDEPKAVLVTGDRIAIHAVAMLDMADKATCLEDALELCGHRTAMPYEHTRRFFKNCREEGSKRFVTRDGLT
ncbi:MAG: hypothetical protein DMD60_06035 [Gemmatimonadetes bacterium]|nr:MAG: hypothetical protein DMD60_06035 [Gemmatimonadota bacterium]